MKELTPRTLADIEKHSLENTTLTLQEYIILKIKRCEALEAEVIMACYKTDKASCMKVRQWTSNWPRQSKRKDNDDTLEEKGGASKRIQPEQAYQIKYNIAEKAG